MKANLQLEIVRAAPGEVERAVAEAEKTIEIPFVPVPSTVICLDDHDSPAEKVEVKMPVQWNQSDGSLTLRVSPLCLLPGDDLDYWCLDLESAGWSVRKA